MQRLTRVVVHREFAEAPNYAAPSNGRGPGRNRRSREARLTRYFISNRRVRLPPVAPQGRAPLASDTFLSYAHPMAKPKPSTRPADPDEPQASEPVIWAPTRFETIRGGLLVCVEVEWGSSAEGSSGKPITPGWTWSVRRGSTVWTAPRRADSATAAQEAALRKADALSAPGRNSRTSHAHT